MGDSLTALLGVPLDRLAAAAWLVLARTLPLAALAPWLGWRGTAGAIRLAIAAAISAALLPLALASAPDLPGDAGGLVLLGLREALIGATFAVAASAPLYALGWSGDLLDRFGGGPGRARREGPLGALHLGAAVVLFVSLGGHRLALAAFASGFADLPIGGGLGSTAGLATGAARVITEALTLAVAFAAPALVAFLALEATLALVGRAAPALASWLDTLSLRAALSVAIALLSLGALLPRLGPAFVEGIDAARALLDL